MKIMILVTTAPNIDSYRVIAVKETAHGETFQDMFRYAEQLGVNAIVRADYNDALSGAMLFHGEAVFVEQMRNPNHGFG